MRDERERERGREIETPRRKEQIIREEIETVTGTERKFDSQTLHSRAAGSYRSARQNNNTREQQARIHGQIVLSVPTIHIHIHLDLDPP